MAHMQQEHTTEWRCTIATHPSQSTTVFHKKEDFENHMNSDHAGTFNSSQLPLLVERCAVPANRPFEKCPICNRLPPYMEDVEKELGDKAPDLLPEHIAGHLKAIAFMFLPPREDDRVYGSSDDHEILEDASNQPSLGSRSEVSSENDLQRPRSATESSLSQVPISSDEASSPSSLLRPNLCNEEEYEETDWFSIPWKQYPKIEEDPKFLSSQLVKTAPLMTSEAHTLGTEKAQTHQEHRKIGLFVELRKMLRSFSSEESQSIRFGTLHWLWKLFPRRLDLEGKVGNPHDPGDGLMYYESDVRETVIILNDFYDAWSAMCISLSMTNPLPKVGQLTSMAKICLVLGGMKQERLFDYFCEAQKTDIDLPLSPETAERILYNDPEHATIFAAEQYRAIRRDWEDGEHIKIAEEEPLPLVREMIFGPGAFDFVRCRDAFESVVYAVKERIVDAVEERQRVDVRSRSLREIDQLQLVKHRHIAQFVKSYQRGSRYGLLIRTAATTDLRGLLARYAANTFNDDRETIERIRDRVTLRPIMLTAFGCLSRGLSCIHAYKMRHKDIKPTNILYEETMSEDLPARFLWTDFGPSHHFGATQSHMSSRFARYFREYASPESMAALRGVHTWHDTDEESDSSLENESDFPDSGSASRRSSDIFSFGCVFLKILSTMTDTELPIAVLHQFYDDIPELQAWAQSQKDRLDTSDSLRVPFALAIEMIRHNPEDRPQIDKVVEVLADTAAAKEYFCPPCLQEVEKLRLERGRVSNLSVPAQFIINGATFSKYECEICCAIKLWIRDANNAAPSDKILGYIIKSMRGKVNGSPLPCQNILQQIQRHSQAQVRSIYMSVYVNKSYWEREAIRVYNAGLKYFDTDSSTKLEILSSVLNPYERRAGPSGRSTAVELHDHSATRMPVQPLEPPPNLLIDLESPDQF